VEQEKRMGLALGGMKRGFSGLDHKSEKKGGGGEGSRGGEERGGGVKNQKG